MASPQKEDGYTAIANEIMEALANIRISGEEWQCLCHILRKTYGWRKIKDAISLSQFEDSTGIKKQNVCRALNRLLSKKIITIIKKDNGITEYALQKDYETWEPLSKKITVKSLSKKIKPVIKKDKETAEIVIKKDTHKRKEYKTTITKEKRSREKFSPPCIEVLTMEFQSKGITGEAGKREAELFFNFYDSKNWYVGKSKMVRWKSAVAGWVSRKKEKEQKQTEAKTPPVSSPPPDNAKGDWLKMINEYIGEGLNIFEKKDLPKIKEKLDDPTYEKLLLTLKNINEKKEQGAKND